MGILFPAFSESLFDEAKRVLADSKLAFKEAVIGVSPLYVRDLTKVLEFVFRVLAADGRQTVSLSVLDNFFRGIVSGPLVQIAKEARVLVVNA
jgi:hypothetical protein